MDWRAMIAENDENWAQLAELDSRAKADNELVGRYITEPHADGCAVYQILTEKDRIVSIGIVTGIGDDWVIPYWGSSTTITKDYAKEKIRHRDAMAELFSKKA